MQHRTGKLALARAARRLLHACRILAVDQGYWRSILEQRPVAADGSPLPWYTYPSIEYLRSFDFSDSDVFEFGAGASSAFWASRARSVLSVEDDRGWHAIVAADLLPNQQVLLRSTESDYVNAISNGRKYNVVVVDGKWRDQCTSIALAHLADAGLLVLDNSERTPEICAFLRESGFFQVDFSGPGPINSYCWTTSIFVRAAGVAQSNYSGPSPVGGLGRLR